MACCSRVAVSESPNPNLNLHLNLNLNYLSSYLNGQLRLNLIQMPMKEKFFHIKVIIFLAMNQ